MIGVLPITIAAKTIAALGGAALVATVAVGGMSGSSSAATTGDFDRTRLQDRLQDPDMIRDRDRVDVLTLSASSGDMDQDRTQDRTQDCDLDCDKDQDQDRTHDRDRVDVVTLTASSGDMDQDRDRTQDCDLDCDKDQDQDRLQDRDRIGGGGTFVSLAATESGARPVGAEWALDSLDMRDATSRRGIRAATARTRRARTGVRC